MKSKNKFGKLKYIGDLLSIYMPSTIIYTDESNNVLVSEWLDICDETKKLNKKVFDELYVSFYVSKKDLKKFINREICHYNFFKCAINNLYYEHVNELNENTIIKEINFSDIKPNNLPILEKSYFNKTSARMPDYEKIIDLIK